MSWLVLIAAHLIGGWFSQPADACSQGDCPRPHNEIALFSYVFPGNPTPTEPQPFRLTGFGLGHTDEDILFCAPGDPNPSLAATEIDWVDFRFFALLPGVGVIKATLNRDQRSFVRLEALTPGGLFPAAFTNNVFLSLSPLGAPELRYENAQVLKVSAPSTSVAPPDSSVVSNLQGQAVFELTTGPGAPGIPERILVTEGVQTFLDPGGLRLLRLGGEGTSQRFRVENLQAQAVTAVYFSYIADTDPALAEDLEGVLQIPPGGSTEFVVDYAGIPTERNPRAWLDVMVLDPIGVQGHDRLEFPLGLPPPIVEVPTLNRRALVLLLVLLAGGGVFFLTRQLRGLG